MLVIHIAVCWFSIYLAVSSIWVHVGLSHRRHATDARLQEFGHVLVGHTILV